MNTLLGRFSGWGLGLLAIFALVACGGGGGGGAGTGDDGGGGGDASVGTLTASAGEDQVTARGAQVSLDGSQSTSSAGAALSYEWSQVGGPDVTGGSGVLTGASPAFTAPNSVDTLSFELRVSAGGTSSAPDTVHINTLEHDGDAFFVDGDNGSDSEGDGSMASPFASISYAIDQISSANVDIYVRTLADDARYDETGGTISPPADTSLYGGYGANWVRDRINNPTGIDGASVALDFADVSADAWFSGFDLSAAGSANASGIVSGVSAGAGSATLYVEDNVIAAGDVGSGASSQAASSYGLRLANVSAVRVLRNTITAGTGGTGQFSQSLPRQTDGGTGSSADGRDGGSGGTAGNTNAAGNAGGAGGRGGGALGGDGLDGANGDSLPAAGGGGAGGSGSSSDTPGGAGGGGFGGAGGRGGNGADGFGTISSAGFFQGDTAGTGTTANSGAGGGGGGGGEGGVSSLGGGGGGGGGGGRAGDGGAGGTSGGASIGILLFGVTDSVVDGNTLISTTGGDGGNGGIGGSGGNGGNGGAGEPADSIGGGEGGGRGGGGGKGGQGGQGGGGGGGPSYAILVGPDLGPVIRNNTLTSGQGGVGGSGGLGGRKGADGATGGNGGTTNASSKASDGAPSEGGWSFGIFDLDPNDGLVPAVAGNNIQAGTPGERGQSGTQNF